MLSSQNGSEHIPNLLDYMDPFLGSKNFMDLHEIAAQ